MLHNCITTASRVPCMLRAPSSVPEGREQQKRAQLSPSVPRSRSVNSAQREKRLLTFVSFFFSRKYISTPPPALNAATHLTRVATPPASLQTDMYILFLNPLLIVLCRNRGRRRGTQPAALHPHSEEQLAITRR